jgi:hypothetical protein
MRFSTFLWPVVAGVLGTLAMTAFTELMWAVLKRPYHVVRTLSTLMQYGRAASLHKRPTALVYTFGALLHYLIGIAFTYLYFFLAQGGITGFTFASAILFGVFIGTTGILGWTIYLRILKNPLNYELPVYLAVIWSGHICLAVVMYCVYHYALPSKAVASSIPMC